MSFEVGQPMDLDDVQALVKGFGRTWCWCRFYYLGIAPDLDARALSTVRSSLKSLVLTSYAELCGRSPGLACNMAFGYEGLRRLNLPLEVLETFPPEFRAGMASQAVRNGDTGLSSPLNWPEYWRTSSVHVIVALYAKTEQELYRGDLKVRSAIDDGRIELVDTQDARRFLQTEGLALHIENPASRANDGAVLEHFGFRDGLSQPVYQGLDTSEVRGGGKFSLARGWQPLATGELLLGYLDEAGELAMQPRPASIARNGTFMVIRKLRQNVDVFRDYLSQRAARIPGTDADLLATLLVGRHRDGSPLDDESLINDFTFVADPAGNECPLGSHIRRANPRMSLGEDTLLVNRHRILRRAITYGEPVPHGRSEAEVNGAEGQGLMFIALNACIERQFEFVQQQWINYGNDLGQGNDRDPLVGANGGQGQFVMPGNAERRTILCSGLPDFVTTDGGDYFFLPGISACDRLISGGLRSRDIGK